MFTQDNYETHGEMYKAHEEFEYNRISDQAGAIALVANSAEFGTPVEAALFKVIAVQSIQGIAKEPFGQHSPTTGYDVFNTIAGGLPMAIMGLTSYGIAKKGYQYGGSTNTISGETVSVDGSFNRNDTSILGNENTNTSPFTTTTESLPAIGE